MQVGKLVRARPIPPLPENTQRFRAGVVTFGLEYRVLTNQMLDEHLASQGSDVSARTQDIDLSGVSIHVFGIDGHEYLRFDCFEDHPHYHYIRPGDDHQRVVPIDTVANGDPFSWAIGRLRSRLSEMLQEAGGSSTAIVLDQCALDSALDELEQRAATLLRRPPESMRGSRQ